MNIEKLFTTRQSTRNFSDKEVSDEILKEICSLAVLAPSAVNFQPYNLYAIKGEKAKAFTPNVQVGGANKWADSCSAYIVIQSHEPMQIKRGERVVSNEKFIQNDVGIITAYIVLAAEALGVQSCIIGLRDEKGIAEFLELDESARFPLVIALGYKAEDCEQRQKIRRDIEQTFKLIK